MSAEAARPTLVIVANGPGEIGGWVLPVARAVRGRAGAAVRLILVMPPSQFASGSELAIAAASGLFDHVAPVRESVRLALGLGNLSLGRPAVLLHLGGDLWFSRRLAARWGLPAFAFAETPFIARFHRAFLDIFVPTPHVAQLLNAQGVQAERVHVTGDPRLDHLPHREARAAGTAARPLHAVLLAGSRERFFRLLFPLWAETALHLRTLHEEVALTIAVAPHLPDPAVEETTTPWRERLAAGRIAVRREGTATASANADLVITIPGTTTMEVAAVPVTALVVLPMQLASAAPMEGLLEWIFAVPWLGPALKRMVLPLMAARRRTFALPNVLSGQPVLPELVGVVTPAQIAGHAAALLRDEPRRRQIEQALAAAAGPRGAAARIAEHLLGALTARPSPTTAVVG